MERLNRQKKVQEELRKQRTQMEQAREDLAGQQERRERQMRRERKRMTLREGRGRLKNSTRPVIGNTITWVRGAARTRTNPTQTNPTLQVQVTGMEEMEVEEGGWDNLSYKDITLMEGDDDHLLEGQGMNRA